MDRRYPLDSIDDCQLFVDGIVAQHNRRNEGLLREEPALMSALSAAPKTLGTGRYSAA